MNQILEFLAENYIYVAGGSAVIIIILLIIIAFGNKKGKKQKNMHQKNDVPTMQNFEDNVNNDIGIPEPILETVPVVNEPQANVAPVMEQPTMVNEPQVNIVPMESTPTVAPVM